MNKYEKAMIRLGLDFTNDKLMGRTEVDEMDSECVFNEEAIEDLNLVHQACEKALNYDRLKSKMGKWYELLKIDGGNTKHQVLVDLEKFIEYSNIKENNESEGEGKK